MAVTGEIDEFVCVACRAKWETVRLRGYATAAGRVAPPRPEYAVTSDDVTYLRQGREVRPVAPADREACPHCGKRPPLPDCPLCKKRLADPTPIHDPDERPKEGPWIEECGIDNVYAAGAPFDTAGRHRTFGCSCGLNVLFHKMMVWVYK